MKIVYLVHARLPTEKAHGIQIAKMCEAFVQMGAEVKLYHSWRRQPEAMRGENIFGYYKVDNTFDVKRLFNIDFIVLRRLFSGKWLIPLIFINKFLWSLYAVLVSIKEKADIYFTRNVEIAFWLTRLNMPTIMEFHKFPARLGKRMISRMSNSKSLVQMVALTSYIKERLIELGIPENKISVIHNSVDIELFGREYNKFEIRDRLGLPKTTHIVGYIGRFRAMGMEKGIPQLIEAMGVLEREKGLSPLLLCVGGPMNAVTDYLKLADTFGISKERMIFHDRVPNSEVHYWMKACDILTIPWEWNDFSAYITCPLKMFEYMATGNPIVASDLPALRDVLEHEKNGLLVPAGDVKELANGIAEIFLNSDFGKTISQNARLDVQEYTWLKRAQKIIDIVANSIAS